MGNLQRRDQALKVAVVASNSVNILIPMGNQSMVIVPFLAGVSTLWCFLLENILSNHGNHLISHIKDSDHTDDLMTLRFYYQSFVRQNIILLIFDTAHQDFRILGIDWLWCSFIWLYKLMVKQDRNRSLFYTFLFIFLFYFFSIF